MLTSTDRPKVLQNLLLQQWQLVLCLLPRQAVRAVGALRTHKSSLVPTCLIEFVAQPYTAIGSVLHLDLESILLELQS